MMSEVQWDLADGEFREPQEVLSLAVGWPAWDGRLAAAEERGSFWEILRSLDVTLLVTREYEHAVLALSATEAGPLTTVLRVPHPSGVAVDRERRCVHLACTRNPNQVLELAPAAGWLDRTDRTARQSGLGLVARVTRFLPGCLYLHDLAIVGGRLMANAVGMNAVIDLTQPGVAPVWWPAAIETEDGPDFSRNLIQLNSIAAGPSLEQSYFTASAAAPAATLPGELDWDIERRGVIFAGSTRQPVAQGLTRPHSARLDEHEHLWVADSGFGTLCRLAGDTGVVVARLPGWTRGLCLLKGFAFIGTSRIIPRFAHYAPGLDLAESTCGVHIVDTRTGEPVASLTWPNGNQVFAVDWVPSSYADRFLGGNLGDDRESIDDAWYTFLPAGENVRPVSRSNP
jgi:uncharacterized protein (TIGR03032 family)